MGLYPVAEQGFLFGRRRTCGAGNEEHSNGLYMPCQNSNEHSKSISIMARQTSITTKQDSYLQVQIEILGVLCNEN